MEREVGILYRISNLAFDRYRTTPTGFIDKIRDIKKAA